MRGELQQACQASVLCRSPPPAQPQRSPESQPRRKLPVGLDKEFSPWHSACSVTLRSSAFDQVRPQPVTNFSHYFSNKQTKKVELRGFEPLTFCMPCRS